MSSGKKALILSVGYGMGHHAAAAAISEELQRRSWHVETVDPCLESRPVLYGITRKFYHFCVRRAPWIWGITYEQTDNSDWARALHLPGLSACTETVRDLVERLVPDVCICTYPLFSHMLDAVNSTRSHPVPYATVVTDALEISRPWATSGTPLLCVPDAASRQLLMDRYAIPPERIVATGFPVRKAFHLPPDRSLPTPENLRVVYGAFAPLKRVRQDVRSLLQTYPGCSLVLLAGERKEALRHLAAEFPGRVELRGHAEDMPQLFARAHLYIGKAGASTLFEAYACGLPLIVNYALPGQEQGNLQLLLADGGGLEVESASALLRAVGDMLAHGATLWKRCSAALLAANRAQGAVNVAEELERRFV